MTDKLIKRFWSYVLKTETCWLWQRKLNNKGYGQFCVDGRLVSTHRVAWELTHGAIPDGLFVLHRCDVKKCVRPEHLFLGNQTDNMIDWATKNNWKGERTPGAKLTSDSVAAIRELIQLGMPQRAIARQFNISQPTVSAVATGGRWSHI